MKFSLPNYEMETPVFGIRKKDELQVRPPPLVLKKLLTPLQAPPTFFHSCLQSSMLSTGSSTSMS